MKMASSKLTRKITSHWNSSLLPLPPSIPLDSGMDYFRGSRSEVMNWGWTLDDNVLVLQLINYWMLFVLTVIWHHRIHEGDLVVRALTLDPNVYQRVVTVVGLSVKTSKNPILYMMQFHRRKLQVMMILIICSTHYLRREIIYVLIILNW